jgi:hypothetical protein
MILARMVLSSSMLAVTDRFGVTLPKAQSQMVFCSRLGFGKGRDNGISYRGSDGTTRVANITLA